MLNLVLFGPPGAGKGTQAIKLIDKYKLIHLSTGDILRNEIVNQSSLGLKAKTFMDKGELVPDEVVIGMISIHIDQHSKANGFIFDGFPRTPAQALALDRMIEQKGFSISAMVALNVDKDELIKRLLLRGKESGRADDQDVNVIENRLKVYNEKTTPLIEYYSAQKKYIALNGMGTIDEIFDRLVKSIDKIK